MPCAARLPPFFSESPVPHTQARVEAKLDDIIGKQNQALAAAEAAATSLSAIQGLAERQGAAQRALETAVMNQLSAIKTATYQNIITLTQALALWKRARRDRCGGDGGGGGGGGRGRAGLGERKDGFGRAAQVGKGWQASSPRSQRGRG